MTIGIVGAGQLGRMLALSGLPLGESFLFLDPSAGAPGGQVAPQIVGAFTDTERLVELASRSDVLTFDWENVSVEALRALPRGTRICPPIPALAASQDRVSEKQLFERLKIPTTRWRAVDSEAQLQRAVEAIGMPGVLKTRRLGYDGKGQAVVRKPADVERAWREIGAAPAIYEEWIPFDFEVSIIGVRGRDGDIAIYPLNGNVHRDGILRLTRAPFGNASLHRRASTCLKRVLEHFRYVGVLTIEFFVRKGTLVANEMAPRVHNSGHWTIEGAVTSQFENHVRAVLGLPLGNTAVYGHAAMINLIGELPKASRVLAEPGVHFHHYGKSPRPGRKLGHCTLVEPKSAAKRDRRVRRLLARLALDLGFP
jgi:5-(carboxyamino)imidazole ribonucleotide synthase